MRLILGSTSPRRRELLAQIGVVADETRAPEVDETPLPRELPRHYCRRMAREKAEAIRLAGQELLLCADTTVYAGRRIFGKPADEASARHFLTLLSGRRHRVVTAVALRTVDRLWLRDVVTIVRVKRLTDAEIESYIATDEWLGKAGAYGLQGKASAFIPWIQGSYSAVVGLPLSETAMLLQAAGYDSGAPR